MCYNYRPTYKKAKGKNNNNSIDNRFSINSFFISVFEITRKQYTIECIFPQIAMTAWRSNVRRWAAAGEPDSLAI